MNKYSDWLLMELQEREWSQADLARLSGVSRTAISDVVSGKRQMGKALANSIAKALKLPPEQVFRAAGILPQAPDVDEETEKIIYESQDLTNQEKEEVLAFIRMKKNFRKKK